MLFLVLHLSLNGYGQRARGVPTVTCDFATKTLDKYNNIHNTPLMSLRTPATTHTRTHCTHHPTQPHSHHMYPRCADVIRVKWQRVEEKSQGAHAQGPAPTTAKTSTAAGRGHLSRACLLVAQSVPKERPLQALRN